MYFFLFGNEEITESINHFNPTLTFKTRQGIGQPPGFFLRFSKRFCVLIILMETARNMEKSWLVLDFYVGPSVCYLAYIIARHIVYNQHICIKISNQTADEIYRWKSIID